jgi:hypothetical protein
MKSTFTLLVAFMMLLGISTSFAQTNPSIQEQQKNIKINPELALDDLIFSYNILNTVEINGSEVDAFIEVRTLFANNIKTAQAANKKGTDEVKIEMNILMAQNFFNLISRAKISGAQAEQYKKVQDAVTNAAKALKEKDKK